MYELVSPRARPNSLALLAQTVASLILGLPRSLNDGSKSPLWLTTRPPHPVRAPNFASSASPGAVTGATQVVR